MRPYWMATYHDNSQLCEFMPGGIVSDFHSIERHRLGRFALVCSHTLAVEYDTATGIFFVNGQEQNHPQLKAIANLPVDYAGGLIQYKKAHVNIMNTTHESGVPLVSDEVLDSINMGFKVTFDGTLIQVIATYDCHTGELSFEYKFTNLQTQEVISNRIEVSL